MSNQIPSMKIAISRDTYPQLHDDLAKVNKSRRAERLRYLASVGQMAVSGNYHTQAQASTIQIEPEQTKSDEKTEGATRLIDKDDFGDFTVS